VTGRAGVRLRPDLTTIPLHGIEPGHVVLATRAGSQWLRRPWSGPDRLAGRP